jgi:hypothetical protein
VCLSNQNDTQLWISIKVRGPNARLGWVVLNGGYCKLLSTFSAKCKLLIKYS